MAFILTNIAAIYGTQGKYVETEPLYKQALTIWEKAVGPDHPYVVWGLNNLAKFYRNQGKPAEAEPLEKRSVAIQDKIGLRLKEGL